MLPIPPSPRLAAALALMLLAADTSGCCRRRGETFSPEASSAAWSRFLPPPADPEVGALLEGLKSGDSVQGYPVVAVGAVSTDGVIPIVLVKEGTGVMVKVAELSDVPPPPASSKHFGVYYETFHGLKPLPGNDVTRVVEDIAARLKRTEDKVPQPKGMKPLPRPTQPA
ncbi:MAG: hypothetical protein HY898_04820 [Deltaproteobacteria bacterium]|nr:hypothetical protein [Deltaproteobacteria bacterium]